MTDKPEIETEAVVSVDKPPRARVTDVVDDAAPNSGPDSAPESMSDKLERKRDYLAGFLAEKPDLPTGTEPGGALYEAVIDRLKGIFDPEIPVNIYDLGLIYGVEIDANGMAAVTMTLTTPHCPVAESMPGEVEMQVGSVPGIAHAEVNLVWDPPWDPQKMSDEAKLELGML